MEIARAKLDFASQDSYNYFYLLITASTSRLDMLSKN